MLTKSQFAFLMTAKKFFANKPHVYFWTFTFKRAMPDAWYARSWNHFMVNIHDYYAGFVQGLRVVEIHPGGHGLHYHAIVDQRMSVHIVRRFGARVGMGRVQVEMATEGAAEYLSKYLAKKNALAPGMRKWGTIGGFKGTRVRDVVIDGPFQQNMKFILGGHQGCFAGAKYVMAMTTLWGACRDWPEGVIKTAVDLFERKATTMPVVTPCDITGGKTNFGGRYLRTIDGTGTVHALTADRY